jgi:hypothetical protein
MKGEEKYGCNYRRRLLVVAVLLLLNGKDSSMFKS